MAAVIGAQNQPYQLQSWANWTYDSGKWLTQFPVWLFGKYLPSPDGFGDFARLAMSVSFWGGALCKVDYIVSNVAEAIFESMGSLGKTITTLEKVKNFPGSIYKVIYTPIANRISDCFNRNPAQQQGNRALTCRQWVVEQGRWAIKEGAELFDNFHGSLKAANLIDGMNGVVVEAFSKLGIAFAPFFRQLDLTSGMLRIGKFAIDLFDRLREILMPAREAEVLSYAWKHSFIKAISAASMLIFSVCVIMKLAGTIFSMMAPPVGVAVFGFVIGFDYFLNAALTTGLISKIFAKYYEQTVVNQLDYTLRANRAAVQIATAARELGRVGASPVAVQNAIQGAQQGVVRGQQEAA